MSVQWLKRLPWIVGPPALAISAVYLAHFQWGQAWRVLAAIDPVWGVGVAAGTIGGFLQVRALRWWLLLVAFGVQAPYGRLYLASSIGLTLSTVTPFQSGELSKVELLKRITPVSRLPAYSAMAVERMLDLGCVLFLAGAGWLMASHWSRLFPQLLWIALVGLALVVAVALVLARLPFRGRAAEIQESFVAIWRRPGLALSSAGLTLLAWLLVAAGWYCVLCAVDLDLGGATVIGLTSLVTLVNVASLVPGGLGVSEAGIASIVSALGAPPAQALAGALAIRGYGLLMLVSGLLHGVWFAGVGRDTAQPAS